MKIAVYAISKNEEKFVHRFCTSAREADCIVIGDTGSTDGTAEMARRLGAVVYDIHIKPWRFDLARNAILALLPADVDICIMLDIDEVLEPGWREEIEARWTLGQTTRLRYKFDYGCDIVFQSDKVHARDGYHWHHPCHEVLRIDPRVQEIIASTDFLLISHHPDPTKSRGHYIESLEASVKEDPNDARNALYYARELTFNGRWAEAIIALERYLAMPGLWGAEVAYAYRLLGDAREKQGDMTRALSDYVRGTIAYPNCRTPWYALSLAYFRRHLWHMMYGATTEVLRIKERALDYTIDPASWGPWAHGYHALAAYRIALYQEATVHGKIATDLAPGDANLATNLRYYLNDHELAKSCDLSTFWSGGEPK